MIKKLIFAASFLLLITFNSSGNELNTTSSKFLNPTVDLGIGAFSLKEDALISRGSVVLISGHFGYLIDENFKLNISPVASFITGQQSSRDPQTPLTNSIFMNEASVENNWSPFFSTKMGSLYQKDFLPGLAGYSRSFPAFGIIIPLEFWSNQKIICNFQIAVPTSSGLATTTSELESSSSLYSGTVNIKSEWNQKINSKLSYSHFVFSNLTSAMAADSLQKGNTVVKVGSSSDYFVYRYSGDEIRLAIEFNVNPEFGFKFDSSYIKNSMAPSDLNSGNYFSINIPIQIKSNFKIRPSIEHYHVESDSMVATFADLNFGRTNRDGYRVGVSLEKSSYSIASYYAKSKLIQNNPFQSEDRSIFLMLSLNNIAI